MENKKFLLIAGGVFVVLVFILVVALTVSSCGKGDDDQTTKTLTFWTTGDEKEVFDEIISDFEKSKGIKIEFVKKQPNEYLSESLNEIAAGKGPDIWTIPNDWLPKYHDKLIPMPEKKFEDKRNNKNDLENYEATFPSVAYQDNVINNQIYGFPLSIDTLVLYYNPDKLNDALDSYRKNNRDKDIAAERRILTNGPKNWDEFVSAVKIIGQNAIALGTANSPVSGDALTLLMLQNGAKMTSDDNTSAQFHTQQNVFSGVEFPGTRALEFYASFANKNTGNYTWNDSLGDGLRAFAEGKTAMLIDYQSKAKEIKNINDRARYEIINVPQIKETKNEVNFASYSTYTVTKASQNSNLAWSFILFLTDSNNSSIYRSDTRKPPARKSSIENNNNEYVKQSLTAKSWYNPEPQKVEEIFKNMIAQVNEGTNAQTAIDGAASQVTTLLEKIKQ